MDRNEGLKFARKHSMLFIGTFIRGLCATLRGSYLLCFSFALVISGCGSVHLVPPDTARINFLNIFHHVMLLNKIKLHLFCARTKCIKNYHVLNISKLELMRLKCSDKILEG